MTNLSNGKFGNLSALTGEISQKRKAAELGMEPKMGELIEEGELSLVKKELGGSDRGKFKKLEMPVFFGENLDSWLFRTRGVHGSVRSVFDWDRWPNRTCRL